MEDNVFQFKKKKTSKIPEGQYEAFEKMKENIQLAKDEERISEIVRGITMAIMNTSNQEGFVITDKEFMDDMTMAMEYVRSAMFRQVGLTHFFHNLDKEE